MNQRRTGHLQGGRSLRRLLQEPEQEDGDLDKGVWRERLWENSGDGLRGLEERLNVMGEEDMMSEAPA